MKKFVITDSKKVKIATRVLEGLLIGAAGLAIHSFGEARCSEGKMIAYEDAVDHLEKLQEFVNAKVEERDSTEEEEAE